MLAMLQEFRSATRVVLWLSFQFTTYHQNNQKIKRDHRNGALEKKFKLLNDILTSNQSSSTSKSRLGGCSFFRLKNIMNLPVSPSSLSISHSWPSYSAKVPNSLRLTYRPRPITTCWGSKNADTPSPTAHTVWSTGSPRGAVWSWPQFY